MILGLDTLTSQLWDNPTVTGLSQSIKYLYSLNDDILVIFFECQVKPY